jgi:hypothetical protein
VLYVLDAADPQGQPESGQRLAGVGDVNGDRVPDIAVEHSTNGSVALFSGVDGTFLFTQERLDPSVDASAVGDRRPSAAPNAHALPELGRVAGDLVIADVSGDRVADIAVAGPSDGQVLIFSGADGSVLYNLQLPWAQPATDPGTADFALASCVDRIRYVRAGDWRTLETFWNVSATGYFRLPAGAQIKVRYGVGWLGYDSQKKTLDGTLKTLRVGSASLLLARMQMKFSRSAYVYYTIC